MKNTKGRLKTSDKLKRLFRLFLGCFVGIIVLTILIGIFFAYSDSQYKSDAGTMMFGFVIFAGSFLLILVAVITLILWPTYRYTKWKEDKIENPKIPMFSRNEQLRMSGILIILDILASAIKLSGRYYYFDWVDLILPSLIFLAAAYWLVRAFTSKPQQN